MENARLHEDLEMTGEIGLLKLQRGSQLAIASYIPPQVLQNTDSVRMGERSKDVCFQIGGYPSGNECLRI